MTIQIAKRTRHPAAMLVERRGGDHTSWQEVQVTEQIVAPDMALFVIRPLMKT